MALPLNAVPLRVPFAYSPDYKVELRLHESLWEVAMTGPELVIEVMTFCSQLELLCQREYQEKVRKPGFRGRRRNYSNTFGTQANLILDKMNQVLQCLPSPRPSIPEYLHQTGLDSMYSRAAQVASDPHGPPPDVTSASVDAVASWYQYDALGLPDLQAKKDDRAPSDGGLPLPLCYQFCQEYLHQTGLDSMYSRAAQVASDPHGPPPDVTSASVDGHFSHLSALNQITALCSQIQSDCRNLHNHKYMAHQVALLYTTLTKFANVKALVEFRTSIETTFKSLKKSLSAEHPQLSEDMRNWLINLTASLHALVTSLNAQMSQPLQPIMNFLHQTG